MLAKRWNSMRRNHKIRINKLHINAKKMNTLLLEGIPLKRILLQRMTTTQKIAKGDIAVLREGILQIKLRAAPNTAQFLQPYLKHHNLVTSFLMSDLILP